MGTSSDQDRPVPISREVTWRQLGSRIWVGRSNGHHVGTIERGRRFTLTDVENGVHRGFSTLSAAQDAATGSIAVVPQLEERRPVDARRPRVDVGHPRSLLSPVSLGMIALALAALAMISGLLQVL